MIARLIARFLLGPLGHLLAGSIDVALFSGRLLWERIRRRGAGASLPALCGAVLALACVSPGHALASAGQESILQDDNNLLYASSQHVAGALDQLAALGVDRVRVSVLWSALAPNPLSPRRPSFDAADPSAYPNGAWERYDRVLALAHERGLAVDFDITAPAPYWAASAPAPSAGFRSTYSPSPSEFGAFVAAIGTRYSGSYRPLSAPATQPLPRVDYWSIWNEPNEGGWLTPQWRKLPHGRFTEAAPVIYRRLVDAGWRALLATGHGTDTILIGETAARGSKGHGVGYSMRPMLFLRALYCVSHRYRPLVGERARELACPRDGNPSRFAFAHPGLFAATGYGHHPYSFHSPPALRMADPQVATLADLPRLERALDLIFAAYGRRPVGGVPLYLDEYGYKSNPPNPFAFFSARTQAAFINQGEYMAYLDPRVRAMAQFLLVDDQPKGSEPVGSRAYWSTFQTGLIGLDGAAKPAYAAYRLPIWLPVARHGRRVTVWGQLRLAPHDARQAAMLEFRPSGGRSYGGLRLAQTGSPRGFILAHVAIPSPGQLRIAWRDPASGTVYRSRAVQVH